jgi:hypothetical protein
MAESARGRNVIQTERSQPKKAARFAKLLFPKDRVQGLPEQIHDCPAEMGPIRGEKLREFRCAGSAALLVALRQVTFDDEEIATPIRVARSSLMELTTSALCTSLRQRSERSF